MGYQAQLGIFKVNSIICQERPWSSSVMTTILQTAVNSAYSDRLKAVLRLTPRLLDVYFSIALRDVNDCKFCYYICLFDFAFVDFLENLVVEMYSSPVFLDVFPPFFYTLSALICALVPLLMSRFATIFPDKIFSYEVSIISCHNCECYAWVVSVYGKSMQISQILINCFHFLLFMPSVSKVA